MSKPRLELVVTHMVVNLASNIKNVSRKQNVRSKIGWTDNTVVLHWLSDNETHIVANTCSK